jgi:hypothetical protein
VAHFLFWRSWCGGALTKKELYSIYNLLSRPLTVVNASGTGPGSNGRKDAGRASAQLASIKPHSPQNIKSGAEMIGKNGKNGIASSPGDETIYTAGRSGPGP